MASTDISFLQINLHNSYRAQEDLEYRISEIKCPAIAFIQEPPMPKKKIQYPKNFENFLAPSKARVGLFIPKNLNFTQIASLTTINSSVALGKLNSKDIILASIYIPPKTKTTPTWLTSIIEYATDSKTGLLLAGDFNAHSPLWGEAQTKINKCGELIEDLIVTHNLNIHNIGHVPTFRNSRDFTSCVDLTLSYKLPFPIQEWKVHDHEMNYSDHNTITYKTTNLDLLIPSFRPWHQIDWEKFTSMLGQKTFSLPQIINHTGLDLSLIHI